MVDGFAEAPGDIFAGAPQRNGFTRPDFPIRGQVIDDSAIQSTGHPNKRFWGLDAIWLVAHSDLNAAGYNGAITAQIFDLIEIADPDDAWRNGQGQLIYSQTHVFSGLTTGFNTQTSGFVCHWMRKSESIRRWTTPLPCSTLWMALASSEAAAAKSRAG